MNQEIAALSKKLATDQSTFSELIEKGAVYVDKTMYIHKMVAGVNKNFFLSRPRRFGKSLLLDTIAELFKGNKELFRGLYIYDKWDWEQKFPVIRLDLSRVKDSTLESISHRLRDRVQLSAEDDNYPDEVELTSGTSPDSALEELIRKLYKKYKQRVVVLIDEYDTPIIHNILLPQLAQATKELMHSFYQVLKANTQYIRFVMLTGISKFSGVSVFSALNNLIDLSLKPEFSAICGYTEEELDKYFEPFMKVVDRKRFREMYNGYNWLGESVYNPLDVMKAIQDAVSFGNLKNFESYWFETGTPSFLVKLMKEKKVLVPNPMTEGVLKDAFSELSVKDLSTEALLFQTGYLTIAEKIVNDDFYGARYRLKYPNREVQLAFNDYLLKYVLVDEDGKQIEYPRDDLNEALLYADFDKLFRKVRSFFASISHRWYTNNEIASSEGFYCSMMFAMFASVCNYMEPESQTNRGQIDLFVVKGGKRYLFEMKVRENARGVSGLEQIIEKGYAEKYQEDGDIYLVGMEFSREARNLMELEYCVGVDGKRTKLTADDKV